MQIQEALRLYTEDKQPLGKINEKYYNNIQKLNSKDGEILPWVENVTCFIINKQDKTVVIQKKYKTESDSKEFTLCSGYVRDGEINRMAMIRKLHDEMGMYAFSRRDLADALRFCGKVKMDFTKGNNKQKKNVRCFTTFYVIDIDDQNKVFVNKDSDFQIAWANYYEVKRAIRASMFGFIYTRENSESFEKVFKNIDKIIEGKDYNISAEEYEREWL